MPRGMPTVGFGVQGGEAVAMRDPDRVSDRSLQLLLDAIVTARASQKAEKQRQGVSSETLKSAEWATLRALEDYAGALEQRRLPVPRLIQQELRLHRALCGVAPPRGETVAPSADRAPGPWPRRTPRR